jgi:hypothetical protein
MVATVLVLRFNDGKVKFLFLRYCMKRKGEK